MSRQIGLVNTIIRATLVEDNGTDSAAGWLPGLWTEIDNKLAQVFQLHGSASNKASEEYPNK
jgi:hypothetical protein